MVAMEAMSDVCDSLSRSNYVTCFLCPLISRFVQAIACDVEVVIMDRLGLSEWLTNQITLPM